MAILRSIYQSHIQFSDLQNEPRDRGVNPGTLSQKGVSYPATAVPASYPVAGECVTLDNTESHHLVKVRRARKGDPIVLLDGAGWVAEAILENPAPRGTVLKIIRATSYPPLTPAIRMLVAFPVSSKAVDLLLQKCTELGVTIIQPILSSRSEMQLSQKQLSGKLLKWRLTMLEACKQSGNPHVPQVYPPEPLERILDDSKLPSCNPEDARRHDENGFRHCMFIASTRQPAAAATETGSPHKPQNTDFPHCELPGLSEEKAISLVSWLVGPEGGFTPQEEELAMRFGYVPVRLAPYVLKTETAVITAAALSRYTASW